MGGVSADLGDDFGYSLTGGPFDRAPVPEETAMSKQSFAFAFVLALATIGTVVSPARSGPDENGWEKMVFHVDDSRYARWMLMLARSYLEDSPKASLVIVAYGPGVDFALEGAEDSNGNPYAPSLFELTSKGVAIRLCGTTLRAREIAPGPRL